MHGTNGRQPERESVQLYVGVMSHMLVSEGLERRS